MLEAVMHSIQPHGIDPIIPWNQKEVLRIMSKLLIWTLVGDFGGKLLWEPAAKWED